MVVFNELLTDVRRLTVRLQKGALHVGQDVSWERGMACCILLGFWQSDLLGNGIQDQSASGVVRRALISHPVCFAECCSLVMYLVLSLKQWLW